MEKRLMGKRIVVLVANGFDETDFSLTQRLLATEGCDRQNRQHRKRSGQFLADRRRRKWRDGWKMGPSFPGRCQCFDSPGGRL